MVVKITGARAGNNQDIATPESKTTCIATRKTKLFLRLTHYKIVDFGSKSEGMFRAGGGRGTSHSQATRSSADYASSREY